VLGLVGRYCDVRSEDVEDLWLSIVIISKRERADSAAMPTEDRGALGPSFGGGRSAFGMEYSMPQTMFVRLGSCVFSRRQQPLHALT
jgi:hypothetical protein